MKVLLNSDLGRVGRKGDLVEVAAGYARNYLIPNKLATMATKGAVKQADQMRRARDERDRKEKAVYEALAGRVASAEIKVVARAGAEGHLFGSVTTAEIAEHLSRALGEDVDRRKIHLRTPIKSLGTHEFSVHLHADVTATGAVEVVSDPSAPAAPAKPSPDDETSAPQPAGENPQE